MSFVPGIEHIQGDKPLTEKDLASILTSDMIEAFLAMSVITMQFAQAGQPPQGFADNFNALKREIDQRIPARSKS